MRRRAFLTTACIGAGAASLRSASGRSALAQTPAAAKRLGDITHPVSRFELGSQKQVFVDWWLIEAGYGLPFTSDPARQKDLNYRPTLMPFGVKLVTLAPAVQPDPIIVPDQPADGNVIGAYSTLMREDGRYRLWYEAYDVLPGGEWIGRICYAESDDGRHWSKPNLGLVEWNGSKQNNVVYDYLGGHGATIFKDPFGPAPERYKLLHTGYCDEHRSGPLRRICQWGAVSPDGLRWTRLPGVLLEHESDTQSVAVFDEERKKYVAYLRGWGPQRPSGGGLRRLVIRAESADFRRLSDPQVVLAPGPDDPPDVDIYTNAYQRWPGASTAHLMLPALYHRAADTVDVHLAVSRDGIVWSRPSKAPLIPNSPPGSDLAGQIYAGVGLAPYGPGQWAFPIACYPETHNQFSEKPRRGGIRLAVLREDGFMALEAETEGECWTEKITFQGSRLLVNSWGHKGSRLLVELATPKGSPIAGFSLADCDAVEEDALWAPVRWKGNSDVSKLAGQELRLRFHLQRCRLHAFRFA